MSEIIRWTPNRKAVAILAVAEGVLTPAQLEELHGVTSEELAEWQQLYNLKGLPALRATRLKMYRGLPNEPRYAGHNSGSNEVRPGRKAGDE